RPGSETARRDSDHGIVRRTGRYLGNNSIRNREIAAGSGVKHIFPHKSAIPRAYSRVARVGLEGYCGLVGDYKIAGIMKPNARSLQVSASRTPLGMTNFLYPTT